MFHVHKEMVERGAALLDELRPGWEEEINLEKLNIFFADTCMLGQLYRGDYKNAPEKDCRANPVSFGFVCEAAREGGSPTRIWEESQELTEAWRALIQERLSAKNNRAA